MLGEGRCISCNIHLEASFWGVGLTRWRTSLNLPGWAVCTCTSYISKSHLRRFLWGLGFLALETLMIKAPRRHLLPVPINTPRPCGLRWHFGPCLSRDISSLSSSLPARFCVSFVSPSPAAEAPQLLQKCDSFSHPVFLTLSLPPHPLKLLQLQRCAAKMYSSFLIFYYITICAENLLL